MDLQILDNAVVHRLGLAFMEFGGRKNSVIVFRSLIIGWAEQLSTIMASLLFCLSKRRSSCFSLAGNRSDMIHAFLLDSYALGRVLKPLKHHGFFDFPITISGSFSVPDMFAHITTETRSFMFLSP